ncbi:MAG: hypothetical protein JWQ04_653 [Pedosphaera sp.]|nr:hypothetical protein [Pedosphaera sp.]
MDRAGQGDGFISMNTAIDCPPSPRPSPPGEGEPSASRGCIPLAPETSNIESLTTEETQELSACEGMIERGLQTFLEVGMALMTIREHRLYRAFGTFDEYLVRRWDFGSRQAQRLMAAAGIVENLRSRIADCGLPAPHSESQVRPLAGLSAEEQFAVWRVAVELAAGERITAKIVRQAARFVTEANEGNGEKKSAVVDVRPVGDREERIEQAVDVLIDDAQPLLELIGTSDSMIGAEAVRLVAKLQELRDHAGRMKQFHGTRTPGRPKPLVQNPKPSGVGWLARCRFVLASWRRKA